MVMGAEELGLAPKITASTLIKKKVCQLGDKFVLAACIHLEVPWENECITEGMAMSIALHEESLNAGLRIPELLVMANLLGWYNLYPVQLVPNDWRTIVASLLDGSPLHGA